MFLFLIAVLLLVGCGENPVKPVLLERDVVIESHADIALLQAEGPAYIIDGDLQIVGSDLSALVGLEGLQRVEGSVEIWFNEHLESLKGLESLTSVGAGLGSALAPPPGPYPAAGKTVHVVEGLMIFRNEVLSNLEGLESLGFVGGGLSIVNNPSLTSLTSLKKLEKIAGSLDIWHNGVLETLAGLDHLLRVRDYLEVSGNGALSNIEGLRGVNYVGADLIITNNTLLPGAMARGFAKRLVENGSVGAVLIEGNQAD